MTKKLDQSSSQSVSSVRKVTAAAKEKRKIEED